MSENIIVKPSITPDVVRAGDSDEFSVKFEVGPDYVDGPSRIVYDFSATLGTSCPTRHINECSGYVEAYVDNPDVEYSVRCWDLDKKYFPDRENPPSREAMRMVVLDLSAGLKAGDEIELRWGETLMGFGPGAKVSSVVPRPGYKARVDIRYFDSPDKGIPDHGRDYIGYQRPIPDAVERLEYAIVPREPRRLRLLRRRDDALLIPYDVFWNVPDVAAEDVAEVSAPTRKNSHGAFEIGDKNVTVKAKSSPMTESAPMDDVFEGMSLFWGDLHTHSAYSKDCLQRSGMDMTPAMLMDFARHRCGLDFFAVTDHHNCWLEPSTHVGRGSWEATLADVEAKHRDDEFVVFPGIEFTDYYGDICLVFKKPFGYDAITQSEYENVSDFRKALGKEFLAIPHLHGPGQKPIGTWREGIDDVSPALELYSDHGSYERENVFENGRAWCKAFREDRNAEYFLKNGHKYALVANSDDHKGHVGVSGVTAAFLTELTRDALFEAYHERRVYGTTNARIRLVFTGNGKLMGSTIPNVEEKTFFIDVVGESRLKKVELFKNAELHQRFVPDGGASFKKEIAIRESEPSFWYVRATQRDNHIAWSSPVWFE